MKRYRFVVRLFDDASGGSMDIFDADKLTPDSELSDWSYLNPPVHQIHWAIRPRWWFLYQRLTYDEAFEKASVWCEVRNTQRQLLESHLAIHLELSNASR